VEQALLEVSPIEELPHVDVVAVFAHAEERLVQRGEALLAIKDEVGRPEPAECRRALELAAREQAVRVPDSQ
jgi:hypothetical protein